MMSPKSIARWQELKTKKLNGRAAPEDMEYRKLRMRHGADASTLNKLRWKAELTGATMILLMNNSDIKSVLGDIIQSEIGEGQKPYSWRDIADFVNIFLAKAKREVATRNHRQLLGSNPLDNNELPGGPKHSN